MNQAAWNDDDDLCGTHVLLPLPGRTLLQVSGATAPPSAQDLRIKDASAGGGLGTSVCSVMTTAVRQVRAAECQALDGPRFVRLDLALLDHFNAMASAEPLLRQAACRHEDWQAWAAAAGALADRMVRGAAPDWPAKVLLLAAMDVDEGRHERWGRLQPLAPPLELQVLKALAEVEPQSALQQALVVLPGQGPRLNALRQALAQHLPDARVISVDTLVALNGPQDVLRQAHVGEAWFPIVGAKQATLQRVEVAVWPWAPQGGEMPPIEVVSSPSANWDRRPGLKDEIVALLRAVRAEESATPRQWKTLVRVPEALLAPCGQSHELALVMADRIARGRAWPGAGRLMATGRVSTRRGARGEVLAVTGGQGADAAAAQPNHKLAAFQAQARDGDTVLLPETPYWREAVAGAAGLTAWATQRPKGATVHFVSHVIP